MCHDHDDQHLLGIVNGKIGFLTVFLMFPCNVLSEPAGLASNLGE
jgi:hypothetical protein